MDADCIFCKIIAGDIPASKIYEDEFVFAFLDIRPVNPGHSLVIPKNHSKDMYSLPKEDLHRVMEIAQKVAIALKEDGAEGINIIMNNGSAADQVIFHAHLHIIPRFKGDGREPWHGVITETKELSEKAEKLRKLLLA